MSQNYRSWGDDEGRLTALTYVNLCQDENVEYAREWLTKQRVRMHAIFVDSCGLDGAAEVCAAYDAAVINAGVSF